MMRCKKRNRLRRPAGGLLLAILVLLTVATPVLAADAPTDTYTRRWLPDGSYELQLSRQMYRCADRISAGTLGLEEPLEEITDVYCQQDGSILLLCGDASRLVAINPDHSLKGEITVTDEAGEPVDFKGAKGIYSDDEGFLYLADTPRGRVLILEPGGKIVHRLERPESHLIPEDFIYQPVSVAKDPQGYIYILSQGCYYGALLYNPEEEFLGFYGASTVKATVQDTLTFLWEKLTSTDEKKAATDRKLPYSFVDFDFDADGYLVTCTSDTGTSIGKDNGIGQIRKISPNGENILFKKNVRKGYVSSSDFNFLEKVLVYQEKTAEAKYHAQTMVSLAVSEDGYIYSLDRTNGLVYIYDEESNLMCAFGGGIGEGAQNGVFKNPVSLSLNGDKLYVADKGTESITVFEPTAYGLLFKSAQQAYLNGDYEEAQGLWEQVLSQDRGNQLAYRGLAMVYYMQGHYELAMETAELALDYTVYDLAMQAAASRWIADNFLWLLLGIIAVIGGIVWLVVILRRRDTALIKNEKVRLLLNVPFHPFDSFTDLKYKKMGSWGIAIVLTALFYIGSTLSNVGVGFLYTYSTPETYSAVYTLASTVGLLILWAVCNHLVCTMFDGKGSIKEVYVATTYSMLPLILYTFLAVIVMNFAPLSMEGLLSGLQTAMILFTFFLLSVAMVNIHEFDFFKFLWTGLITVAMMLLVVFVIFMCAILLMQFGSLIEAIYEEVFYR